MEHAAAIYNPLVLAVAFLYPEGKIAVEFGSKTVADMTGSDVLAVFAEEWTIVDGEQHRHCGLIYSDTWQRFGIVSKCYGVTDFKAFDTD